MSKVEPVIPALPLRNFEHSGRELFSQINSIPPEAAKSVAELFELIAKELKDVHRVHIRQKAIAAYTKKELFKLHQLPVRVQECPPLNSGITFKDAVGHLRSTTGAPQTTIYSYWLQHIKKLEREAFNVRDAQVWEMYKSGLSDQEISKAVELSIRQVQRVIRAKRYKSQSK